MKFSEIKNLKTMELRKKLASLRQNFFDSKMKLSMKRLANPLILRSLRRDIARVQTAIRLKHHSDHLKKEDEK